MIRCSYCGRYGPFGSCAGCGAPVQPNQGMVILTSQKPLTAAEADRLKAAWERAHTGVQRAGSILCLSDGVQVETLRPPQFDTVRW
jgi:hypothetical protein